MARMTPPKSPMISEKHQTGCMFRLYGLFDFRQGRSSKNLISDKRHSNRFDKKVAKMKLDLSTDFDEKSQSMDDQMKNKTQTVDYGMTSTRKHNEEKLSSEVQMNNKIDSDASKRMPSNNAGSLPKKKGKVSKNSEAKNEKPSHSVSVEKSFNKLNSTALAEAVHFKKQRECGCKTINPEITSPQAQKKAAEAIKNRKIIDEKYIRADGVNYQSRQLSDALEILNSNKDLFLKLLQDPSSILAKSIEGRKVSEAVEHPVKSPSDVNFSTPKQCDVPAGVQNLKSCDTCSYKERDDSHLLDRVVVLKPGPTSMQSDEDNSNQQSEIPAKFSYSQMKKKLRHAIGVGRKELLDNAYEGSNEECKGKGVEIIRRNSPGGGMLLSPLDIRKRDNISWERECGSPTQSETASTSGSGHHPRRRETESSLEARLLELLSSGNNVSDEKMEQKTFSEYDFLPTRSPVGLSPYGNYQLLYENKWRLQKETISCTSPTVNKYTMHQEEINYLEVVDELEGASRSGDCIEKINAEIQEQPSTSSPYVFHSPPRIERIEDSPSFDDKGEHLSPVSVLEQFFVDAISEPAEERHSPRPMRSAADIDSSTFCSNEHELISEYIEAILRAANFDWDEISMMCDDSTDQLLDPFLFDTVKLQGNQSNADCMLLFDCIDEVLVDVYINDIRYPPYLSFIKPNVRQLPVEKTVINRVLNYVELQNSRHHPTPRRMQQVVDMDIARCGTWLDIRKDAEDVIFRIVEGVLEELVTETII